MRAADALRRAQLDRERVRAVDVRAAPAPRARPGVTVHRAFCVIHAFHRTRAHRALPREIERHIGADGPAARAVRREQRNLAHRRDRIRRVEHEALHCHRRCEHDIQHRRCVAGETATRQRTHSRAVIVMQPEIRHRAGVVVAQENLHAPNLPRRWQRHADPMPACARITPPRIARARDAIGRELRIVPRRCRVCPCGLILRPIHASRRRGGWSVCKCSGQTCEQNGDELEAAMAVRRHFQKCCD